MFRTTRGRRVAAAQRGGGGPLSWGTDFSGGVGEWSDQWNPFENYAAVADAEAEGGFKWLQQENVATDRNFLRYDDVPEIEDCRIFGRVSCEWANTGFNFRHNGLLARASGDAAGANGYALLLSSHSSGARKRVNLWKYSEGVLSPLENLNETTWVAGTFRNLELSVVGADLEVRQWAVGDERPETPYLTYTDPSPLPAGRVGIVNERGSNVANGIACDVFEVVAL